MGITQKNAHKDPSNTPQHFMRFGAKRGEQKFTPNAPENEKKEKRSGMKNHIVRIRIFKLEGHEEVRASIPNKITTNSNPKVEN